MIPKHMRKLPADHQREHEEIVQARLDLARQAAEGSEWRVVLEEGKRCHVLKFYFTKDLSVGPVVERENLRRVFPALLEEETSHRSAWPLIVASYEPWWKKAVAAAYAAGLEIPEKEVE